MRWDKASARVSMDGRDVKITRLKSGRLLLKCSCYVYRGGSMPHRTTVTAADVSEAVEWVRSHDHSILTLEDGKREMWRQRRVASECAD